MTPVFLFSLRRPLAVLASVLALLLASAASAGPGAHGPNGEHLDAPGAGTSASAGATTPRLEAKSELFELVARLQGGELSLLIDRFATNEPVLQASVEIESGPLKAPARFHADLGDYAVDDPAMLKLLSTPGAHPVVITILAGEETDLLDGMLHVSAAQAQDAAGHAHGTHGTHGTRWWPWALGGTALLLAAWLAWRKRRAVALVLGVAVGSAQAGPGAHGPNGEHLDQAAAPATSSASSLVRLPDGSVNVPKLAQRRMGLRTAIAPESEAAATVQLPGRVIADPNASGLVQSAHGGRIEPGPKGLPLPGQAVRQGEVLAWVRHHADPFAQAAQQTQRAELRAAGELARQRLARLETLQGTVPRKEIEAARIEADSLAERERHIGASLQAREALRAPVSGVIARAGLQAGQMVESREVLLEVVDPARMLVEASTPDVRLASQIGAASLAGVAGSTTQDLTLHLVGAARALRDGVLPLTFRLQAGAGAMLAVGQPVVVTAALKARRKGIVLPAEAVVRSPANEAVVWIKSGAERYVPQPVQVQPLDSHTVLVTQGLAADNRVLVRGAALVAQIR